MRNDIIATDKQINLIRDLCEQLVVPPPADLEELSISDASILIQQLIDDVKEERGRNKYDYDPRTGSYPME